MKYGDLAALKELVEALEELSMSRLITTWLT
jgi:hypothetical protein